MNNIITTGKISIAIRAEEDNVLNISTAEICGCK